MKNWTVVLCVLMVILVGLTACATNTEPAAPSAQITEVSTDAAAAENESHRDQSVPTEKSQLELLPEGVELTQDPAEVRLFFAGNANELIIKPHTLANMTTVVQYDISHSEHTLQPCSLPYQDGTCTDDAPYPLTTQQAMIQSRNTSFVKWQETSVVQEGESLADVITRNGWADYYSVFLQEFCKGAGCTPYYLIDWSSDWSCSGGYGILVYDADEQILNADDAANCYPIPGSTVFYQTPHLELVSNWQGASTLDIAPVILGRIITKA